MKKLIRISLLALALAGCFTLFALADSATDAAFVVIVGIPLLLAILAVIVIAAAVIIIRSGNKMRSDAEPPEPARRKKK